MNKPSNTADPAVGEKRAGFTLVELLVVIGVIAVLIGILLPALGRARDTANTIKCAANLRSIGQGLMAYAAENDSHLPSAYNFRGSSVDAVNGVQTPAVATWGYEHWSGSIFGTTPTDSFQCPTLTHGGFPPANPRPGGFDSDQTTDPNSNGGTALPAGYPSNVQPVTAAQAGGSYWPDEQAARLAYTLNEALCGRNKYVIGFGTPAAQRTYHPVKLTQVDNQTGTILATEFVNEWGIVSGVARDGSPQVCRSHRPVQPFREDSTAAGDTACDVSNLSPGTKLRKTNRSDFFHLSGTSPRTHSAIAVDLVREYQQNLYTPSSWATRLDWVGRNHGSETDYADRKTNFLYCDGHVETKSIADTVPADTSSQVPWEWGAQPYSVSPNATNP